MRGEWILYIYRERGQGYLSRSALNFIQRPGGAGHRRPASSCCRKNLVVCYATVNWFPGCREADFNTQFVDPRTHNKLIDLAGSKSCAMVVWVTPPEVGLALLLHGQDGMCVDGRDCVCLFRASRHHEIATNVLTCTTAPGAAGDVPLLAL